MDHLLNIPPKIQKFRETGNSKKHLYRNELEKVCFPNDASYSESKDLAKRTIPDKSLRDTAYEIARNHGYVVYQRAFGNMVYQFFDKEIGSGAIAASKAGVSANEQLAEELQKPVTKKFKRRKVYARLRDNIWAADLAEIESLSSNNKNVKYLLRVIDVFTK